VVPGGGCDHPAARVEATFAAARCLQGRGLSVRLSGRQRCPIMVTGGGKRLPGGLTWRRTATRTRRRGRSAVNARAREDGATRVRTGKRSRRAFGSVFSHYRSSSARVPVSASTVVPPARIVSRVQVFLVFFPVPGASPRARALFYALSGARSTRPLGTRFGCLPNGPGPFGSALATLPPLCYSRTDAPPLPPSGRTPSSHRARRRSSPILHLSAAADASVLPFAPKAGARARTTWELPPLRPRANSAPLHVGALPGMVSPSPVVPARQRPRRVGCERVTTPAGAAATDVPRRGTPPDHPRSGLGPAPLRSTSGARWHPPQVSPSARCTGARLRRPGPGGLPAARTSCEPRQGGPRMRPGGWQPACPAMPVGRPSRRGSACAPKPGPGSRAAPSARPMPQTAPGGLRALPRRRARWTQGAPAGALARRPGHPKAPHPPTMG